MLLAGTVMDIPFPTAVADNNLSNSPRPYNVMFDNGMTTSIPLLDMSDLILEQPVNIDASNSQDYLLLPFLHLNSKNTYKHEGLHLKGFLGEQIKVYQFMFKSHVNKHKEDWGVNLPDLPFTWVDSCVEGVFVLGHVSHSCICSPLYPQTSTFYPIASFVSAVNLHCNCPPTLLNALVNSHPDSEVWLQSYYK